MRNCFVPNCDQVSKNILKRKMFFPPKNPEIFKAWENALPKKRQFRTLDRVCERHFRKEEISQYWEHIINGKVHLLERGKPRLVPIAIPSLNLPSNTITSTIRTTTTTTTTASTTTTALKTKTKPTPSTTTTAKCKINKTTQVSLRRSSKASSKNTESLELQKLPTNNTTEMSIPLLISLPDLLIEQEIQENQEQPIELNSNILQTDELMPIVANELNENNDNINITNQSMLDNENNQLEIIKEDPNFDLLYDDIYEVELPSTQYGIHRDPNRKYIVISFFDINEMSATKVLYIDCYFKTKIYIYNVNIKCNSHTDSLNVELISEMLNEIDEYSICEMFHSNKHKIKSNNIECLIISMNNSRYCSNCKL